MPSTNRPSADSAGVAAQSRAGLRLETALVLGIVLAGLVLRIADRNRMAIEHFDEGVYASNLYCGHLDPPFAYPMRHLYAPPLFPAILEWAQILAGPAAVMWVNVLLGSLTVLAIWWTTREWFGRSAAIAAAMLAATSEYHIAFSRMALTDVPLSLFMLLGVYAGWKAILTGRPLWIAAAGLLAGLAWCTKYNGWLTLAVTGSGTLAAFFVPKLLLGNALTAKLLPGAGGRTSADSSRWKKKIANCSLQIANCKLGSVVVRWGITAAIAGVVFWVFVVRDLAPLGGYAAVARNHAGYFVGLGGWWSGFLRQAAAHDLLMGWVTGLGIGGAWLACAWCGRFEAERRVSVPSGAARWIAAAAAGICLMLLAWLLSVSGLLGIAAVCGVVCVLRRPESSGSADDDAGGSDQARLAAWLLCAWFVGLLVATPLYYPYPRLSVPWVVVCWPLAGAAMREAARWLVAAPGGSKFEIRYSRFEIRVRVGFALWGGVGLLCALLLLTGRGSANSGFLDRPRAWQARTIVAETSRGILARIEAQIPTDVAPEDSDVDTVIYVQGNPAVFLHLSELARSAAAAIVVVPVAESDVDASDQSGVRTYLVSSARPFELSGYRSRYRLRQGFTYVPSQMVLLDRLPAGAVREIDPAMLYELWLYEVGPVR